MATTYERAIVKTLIYADIFDYPLTNDEICRFLIKGKRQKAKGKITIKNLKRKKIIFEKKGYYFLRGRDNIVEVREERTIYSQKKTKIVRKVVSYLKLIPTVKLIALTGALAVNNSKEDDDIDLMIISKRGFLWTTRFLVTLLVELLGVRRRPGDFDTNNKICLNMFLDEDHLSIPKKERDLFSAHEVVQMRPIYDKDETYCKFLQANLWVEKYLPNSLEGKRQKAKGKITIKNLKVYISFIENFFKKLQLWYMSKRRTTEVLTAGVIRFHPEDAGIWVMKRYRSKLSNLLNLFRRISF